MTDHPTRSGTARVQAYRPPNKLSMPVPHDPDVVFRYVRVSLRGQDDSSNWKAKRADGWEPVKAENYPEFLGPSHEMDGSRFAGCIGTGDLVLMMNHRVAVEARTDYYSAQTDAQMAGVDHDLMRGEDPRMPIFSERKTRQQVVGPRKVAFDD